MSSEDNFVEDWAGVKFLPLTLALYTVLACGDGRVTSGATQQDQVTAVGIGGGYPIAYLGQPLRLTDDGEKYVVNVETLNASSYRYAVVMTKWLQHRELAATVLDDPQFVAKLMKSAGDTLIARIVDDPATMKRVKLIALRVYANPSVMGVVEDELSDEERRELLTVVSANDQRKLFEALMKLSKNTEFMTALLSTLAMNGGFLAQVLAVGKDDSLLAEVLDKEFISELIASGEEGKFLEEIMELDVAVKQLEKTVQRLLDDEETLKKILVPTSFEAAQELMQAMLVKFKELDDMREAIDVNYIREQIAALLKGLGEEEQLIAIIFSELLFEAAFIADHSSFCEEDSVEWTTVKDVDDDLLFKNLGDDGMAVLCLIAVDEDGNEQPVPTVEPVVPTEPEEALPPVPSLKLAGNLPEDGSSSALTSLRVEVAATTDTVAGYRYRLLHRGGDCPSDPTAYDAHIHALPVPLRAELKLAGPKTLCVFGVNRDGMLTTPIVTRQWELTRGTAQLEISGSTQDLYFDDHQEIVLRNVGNAGMFWSLYTPDDIDWLEIRAEAGEWLSLRRASTHEQLLHGAILAHDIAKLQLRVVSSADRMQEAVLYVKHLDSTATFPIRLKLHSGKPSLTVQGHNVDLTPERLSAWIGVVNTNREGTLRWKVRHVFPVDRIGIEITDTRQDRIDDEGWHVGGGSIKVEMLHRPRPTTAKIQVFIFEFKGGKRIPLAVTYLPPGWRYAD